MILNLNSFVVKALMAVGRAGRKTAENYAGSDIANSTQIPFLDTSEKLPYIFWGCLRYPGIPFSGLFLRWS